MGWLGDVKQVAVQVTNGRQRHPVEVLLLAPPLTTVYVPLR